MSEFGFEAAGRLVGGSGLQTIPYELSKDEVEVLRVIGSQRPGMITSVGGDLVLTSLRVIFTPLNTADLSKLLSFALGKAGVGKAIGIVDTVQGMIGTAAPIGPGALSAISSIDAGSNGSFLKPPTLIIRGADGSSAEVGVLEERTSPNFSAGNRIARDRFLQAALQAISQ